VIGVGAALIRRASLDAREEWRGAIVTPEDLVGYFGCIENGSTFRTLAGVAGVGTEGGSEDHAAILTCRAGALSEYAFAPVRRVGETPMPSGWSFVVASSGVRADKAGTARERFNRASLAARVLLDVWNGLGLGPALSLAAALESRADAADRLHHALQQQGAHESFSADDLARRLAHFVREDARVPRAAEAFAVADAAALDDLSRASQSDAETLLGNQVPETADLTRAARTCGALAACSFGAGFGGSVWALVPTGDEVAFGDAWMSAYRARHPHLAAVEWFVAPPAPAIVEV
jgi:galactokinase